MSKAQFYDPKQLRAPGEIHFQDIDVCKYQKTVADELKGDSFTKEDMLRIYRDMEYIREFESMLKSVRLTKAYNGVEYTYTGPAHLYTGEESAAVGQSYLLDSNDFIFGTHRSHGEVLAKGLSAITKMSDEELLHIMETTFDGKPYEVVKKHLPEKSVKEQAIVFFLYGLTCELFGRENGFARGLGNSMHLFFLPFGIYPNNAIVGGSPCIAAGAALYKKNMKAPGVAKGYKAEKNKLKIEHVFPSKSDLKRIFPTLIRSSIIGTFIGAVPGTGGDIASWVSYSQAKTWSKHKEEFGHGSPEGLAACESGNNAISGGAFVPLLSLGIPGDAGTAVMLGSLTMLGLAPGPLLFTEHKDSVYMLFVGLFVANLLMGILGFAGIRLWSRVLDIPQKILLPLIFTFCFVGTYACNRSLNDVYMMIIAGIAGYVLQKMDFSLPPIILGVILGGMIEKNFRRALILSNGDVGTFFTRPISCVFIILAAVSLFSPVIKTVIASKKAKKQAAAATVNDSESAS